MRQLLFGGSVLAYMYLYICVAILLLINAETVLCIDDQDRYYVGNQSSHQTATHGCKLATPILHYTSKGTYTLNINKSNVHGSESITNLPLRVGYVEVKVNFFRAGCLQFEYAISTKLEIFMSIGNDPGHCFTFCKTDFIGIWNSSCFCFSNTPECDPCDKESLQNFLRIYKNMSFGNVATQRVSHATTPCGNITNGTLLHKTSVFNMSEYSQLSNVKPKQGYVIYDHKNQTFTLHFEQQNAENMPLCEKVSTQAKPAIVITTTQIPDATNIKTVVYVGIATGVVVAIAIVICVVLVYKRRNRKDNFAETRENKTRCENLDANTSEPKVSMGDVSIQVRGNPEQKNKTNSYSSVHFMKPSLYEDEDNYSTTDIMKSKRHSKNNPNRPEDVMLDTYNHIGCSSRSDNTNTTEMNVYSHLERTDSNDENEGGYNTTMELQRPNRQNTHDDYSHLRIVKPESEGDYNTCTTVNTQQTATGDGIYSCMNKSSTHTEGDYDTTVNTRQARTGYDDYSHVVKVSSDDDDVYNTTSELKPYDHTNNSSNNIYSQVVKSERK